MRPRLFFVIFGLLLGLSQSSWGQSQLLQTSGKLSLLRVHEVGTKYGPASDQIDVEVVIKFSNNPQKAYGFRLRNESNDRAHEGMLSLLRDAFNYNHNVTIDFETSQGKNNGTILRVWLSK